MIDQLNIGIRFALYADLMLLFGLPLFGLYALKGAERLHDAVLPFRAFIIWLSLTGIALSLLSIVAMTAAMAGVQLSEADRASVSMMIFETPMGNAWGVRVLFLISTLTIAFWMRGAKGLPKLVFVALGSGVALASQA
jgi:copper resistance protein D